MKKHAPCTLYVVRHGETDWNRQGLVQGHSDIPLTENGEAQAHARAEHFKEIHFSHVACSDLARAHHTAKILAKDRKVPLQVSPVLREMSWGPWEGHQFDMIREKFGAKFNAYTGEQPHHVPGVESYYEVVTRVKPFLCDVASDHLGNNVLVVTHGSVLKAFVYYLGISQLFHGHFDNLGYLKLEYDGTALNFVEQCGLITPKYDI